MRAEDMKEGETDLLLNKEGQDKKQVDQNQHLNLVFQMSFSYFYWYLG